MKNNKTILQIVPALNTGGVERGVIEISKYIVDNNFRSIVISSGGKLEYQVTKFGGLHYKLDVHSKNFLKWNSIRGELTKIIVDENVSLIHVCSRVPAWLAVPIAKKLNIPLITSVHGRFRNQNILKNYYNSILLKGDQIIAGTVLNIAAIGITSFFFSQGRTLPSGKTQQIRLGPLADIPVAGRVLFSNRPITYLTLLMVVVLWFCLFRTTWGLRTRAVGEHPSSAETVGISVVGMRYLNVILGGGIAGLAGAYLSLEAVGSFERGMTNGKGFVALAVMIFGRWNPLGAWGAALLFGYASAIQTQFQFRNWLTDDPQFIGMIPFVVTIVVLAGFVGRARPPAAIGQPYSRE